MQHRRNSGALTRGVLLLCASFCFTGATWSCSITDKASRRSDEGSTRHNKETKSKSDACIYMQTRRTGEQTCELSRLATRQLFEREEIKIVHRNVFGNERRIVTEHT